MHVAIYLTLVVHGGNGSFYPYEYAIGDVHGVSLRVDPLVAPNVEWLTDPFYTPLSIIERTQQPPKPTELAAV